jgi:hypothetical protein
VRSMKKLIPLGLFVGVMVLMTTACGTSQSEQQRESAVKQRISTFQKAQNQVPTPNVSNFPRRKTLADSVVRQSQPNHPWYVYVLGQNGNVVNYFVAKSVPVNDCDYLSSTQNVQWDDNGNIVLDSPSLEGIYQSSSGCNTLTFFDLGTNAEVQVTAIGTYITDRPLKVDAQPLKVRSSK